MERDNDREYKITVCFINNDDMQLTEYSWEDLKTKFNTNSILMQQIIDLRSANTGQIIVDFDNGCGEIIIWESPNKEHC